MGAIPWVVMQLLLVVIVIFVPETVTAFLDKEQALDLNKATEDLMNMNEDAANENNPSTKDINSYLKSRRPRPNPQQKQRVSLSHKA